MAFTYTGEQVDLSFGRGWLDRPAAASIRRIDRQLGHALQITEAGRTWAKQDEHYQRYLRVGYPIALNPDTPSVHQQGGAIDSNEAQRIIATLEDHGWRRTVYRWVNGVWTLVEPWHFEYFAHLDNHRNDPAPASGGAHAFDPNTEEDDMITIWGNPQRGYIINGENIFLEVGGEIERLTGVPGPSIIAAFVAGGAREKAVDTATWDRIRVTMIASQPQTKTVQPIIDYDVIRDTIKAAFAGATINADVSAEEIDAIANRVIDVQAERLSQHS